MAKSIDSTLSLPNSVQIPQLGFGVYKSPRHLCKQSVATALQTGYRHVDTAQIYGNEEEVGQAVKQSGLARKDVFLTTKILRPASSFEDDYKQCMESIQKLDQVSSGDEGYVDLFLIHSPHTSSEIRERFWKVLERLHEEGRARSIGVSNFGVAHLEEMNKYAKVWPHVNQIELHPWAQQREAVRYCEEHHMCIEAYCPIVRNQKADDGTLVDISKKHSVTPNQVLIRYCLEKGWIPLPKSDNADRIKKNADVFGFQLDEEDMTKLDGLDQGAEGAICEAVVNDSLK